MAELWLIRNNICNNFTWVRPQVLRQEFQMMKLREKVIELMHRKAQAMTLGTLTQRILVRDIDAVCFQE